MQRLHKGVVVTSAHYDDIVFRIGIRNEDRVGILVCLPHVGLKFLTKITVCDCCNHCPRPPMIVQDIVPLYLSSKKSQCQETSSPVVLFQSLGLAQSPPLYPGSDFSTRKEAMTPRKIINVLVVRISPLTH